LTDFQMDKTSSFLAIQFGATLDNVDLASKEIKCALIGECPSAWTFAVELVVREALDNAVLHGCKGNPEGKVKCRVSWDDNLRISIVVEDDGDGFNWRSHRRRTVSSHSTSGRGLTIMKRYGTDVHFNAKGNMITIEMDLSQGGRKGEYITS
jgi:serine/threonine-protein kinase RsbW